MQAAGKIAASEERVNKMALGQFGGSDASENGAGGFTARVEYNAKAGRFYRVERVEVGGSYETQKVEIRDNEFSAVFDLENIEVGWAYFAAGSAPSIHLAKLGGAIPARPNADHKQAFKLRMALSKGCAGTGDQLREFMSSANGVRGAMDKLHDDFVAGSAQNPGKLPAVKVKAVIPVTNKHGTNYTPDFEIVGWVDRPAVLGDAPAQAAPATRAATPPATGSTAPAAQPVSVDADDFG
jgi:hypothetical protein